MTVLQLFTGFLNRLTAILEKKLFTHRQTFALRDREWLIIIFSQYRLADDYYAIFSLAEFTMTCLHN